MPRYSHSIWGSCVDLPDPVSPSRIMRSDLFNLLKSSLFLATIGNLLCSCFYEIISCLNKFLVVVRSRFYLSLI